MPAKTLSFGTSVIGLAGLSSCTRSPTRTAQMRSETPRRAHDHDLPAVAVGQNAPDRGRDGHWDGHQPGQHSRPEGYPSCSVYSHGLDIERQKRRYEGEP